MAYFDRQYETFAILGDNDSLPWTSHRWHSIAATLNSILIHSRGKAAVRSSQLGGMMGAMKPVSFGRLAFDSKSHDKWTHSTNGILLSGVPAVFLGTEVWSPSWTVCEREVTPPDVYLDVTAAASGMPNDGTHSFGSTLILAVGCDFMDSLSIEKVVTPLADTVGALLIAHQVRPWGKAYLGGFTDGIQDLLPFGLFGVGSKPYTKPVSLSLLQGEWRKIVRKD